MSEGYDFVIGSHIVTAMGSVSITSCGTGVDINATGDEGSLQLNAKKVAGMFAGTAVVSLENKSETAGSVVVAGGLEGTITQTVGPPIIGATMKMQPEEIKLSVGLASITMTPESIIFRVGETSVAITLEGITESLLETTRELTPIGHTFTAAETEVSYSVTGEEKSVPMQEVSVMGPLTEEAGLVTRDGGGVLDATAGVTMIA